MKEDVLRQIKSEMRYKQQDERNLRDAEYFKALAAGRVIARSVATKQSQTDPHKELVKRLHSLSGLPSTAPRENKLPQFKKIYETLERYVAAFPNCKKPNLIFIGGVGTGKTHATQFLGNHIIDRGFSVIFTTAFSLVQRFKDYIFNFEHAALDHLLTCDLLIIDDLGTEPKIKNISDEHLLNVINERLANNSPFLITTNLSADDIKARYDQRLASRILSEQSSVVIEFTGKDLRLS